MVDLPHPDDPVSATTSPLERLRSTHSSTATGRDGYLQGTVERQWGLDVVGCSRRNQGDEGGGVLVVLCRGERRNAGWVCW